MYEYIFPRNAVNNEYLAGMEFTTMKKTTENSGRKISIIKSQWINLNIFMNDELAAQVFSLFQAGRQRRISTTSLN